MAVEGKELLVQIPPVFFLYKDGSVQRCPPAPLLPPSPEPGLDGVASKDLTLDGHLGLWARLFLPSLPPPPQKLPIVLYFHGGCFLFGGPSWSHSFCAAMAKQSSSIWVAASYRLGPEHRLPAAYDDGFSALRWLDAQAQLQIEGKESLIDDWLATRADFSNCFIAGASAGGSIAHHVTMRALNPQSSLPAWEPALNIEGLILMHPGFVREKRTKEEMEAPQDMMMSWALVDICMQLVGLAGVDKDHPYANPLSEFSAMGGRFVLPRTLVAMAERDALQYMSLEYIEALKGAGCSVDSIMSRNVGHVFFSLQPECEQARILFETVCSFISERKGDSSASSK